MFDSKIFSVFEQAYFRNTMGNVFPAYLTDLLIQYSILKGSSQSQVGGVTVFFSILNFLKSKKLFEKACASELTFIISQGIHYVRLKFKEF